VGLVEVTAGWHQTWRFLACKVVEIPPTFRAGSGLFRGLYGVGCGGTSRVPGVMMTSPVDLRQTSYTRSGSIRM